MRADAEEIAKPITKLARFPLQRFNEVTLPTQRNYCVKGLIPKTGIALVWGPPKCGKSFFVMDLVLHVALGRDYRGRRVQRGPVVYFAAEGAHGFAARIEAYRKLWNDIDPEFFLVAERPDLVANHTAMTQAIRDHLGDVAPAIIVIDTLNRTFSGSESSDQDMTAYVQAADAIVAAFGCAVLIVHHCGVGGTRPRGHTALSGAVDAQISISKAASGTAYAKVDLMKDGPEGDVLPFRLDPMDVGIDEDGDPITSCVVVPIDVPVTTTSTGPKLSANQQTVFSILQDAGAVGLSMDDWNQKAREAGIGEHRRAALNDIRKALEKKRLIHSPTTNHWVVWQ